MNNLLTTLTCNPPILMAHKWRPPTGTVLWLPGQDDAYSATIRDKSGYANNGTIVGATWSKTANTGVWTLRYDGDDYVNIDVAVNDLAATTKGTWMSWVKLDDATPAAVPTIIGFGDTNLDEYISMFISTEGKLGAIERGTGASKWIMSTDAAVLSDGIYIHLALIQDGVFPVLLVNGVAVAQTISVTTDTTAWFPNLTGLDNGRIGCVNQASGGNTGFITNGNTFGTLIVNTNLAVTQVKGIYDEQRNWLGV